MNYIAIIFGKFIYYIYAIVNNYLLSIFIFTLISRIILFPINIVIQKNSIKMLKMKPKLEKLKYDYWDDKEKFMDEQIRLFEKEKYKPSLGIIPLLIQIPIVIGLSKTITNSQIFIGDINTNFMFINLANNPNIKTLYVPIFSIITTIALCYFQNISNILQKAESIKSKVITTLITCIVTAYFVMIVPNGVGIYWAIGNILAIIQMYILNVLYPPKKYVDYDEIIYWKNRIKEKSLSSKENKIKEKNDYKRFIQNKNKKIVFFSEKNGFYKYYSDIIDYIINNSNITIHYITNDYNDEVLKKEEKKFKVYYVGKNKCISLFMKMDADIVVMTTPDLQKYYIKRSLVRDDIEYVFLDHGMASINLTNRTGAVDHFDTIFANGPEQIKEIEETEELRNTKKKNLIKVGYPLMDGLIKEYNEFKNNNYNDNDIKTILIAPSYQDDNILEAHFDEIIKPLLNMKGIYKIIVRPHPQFIKRKKECLDKIIDKYKEYIDNNFYFELDFSSNETIYKADLVITDWSGIGFEYALSTLKPTLYINTKMKIINKDYDKIETKPLDISIRDIIGKSIDISNLRDINDIVIELINNQKQYMEKNNEVRNRYLFNVGNSAKVAGEYLINKIEKGE